MKQYSHLPIFREAYDEVLKLTWEMHRQIIENITIKEKKAPVVIEAIKNLYITNYINDPLELALQKISEEIRSFISYHFSVPNTSVVKENVDIYSNRRSVYMKSMQNVDANENSYHFKTMNDLLYDDGDGLAEYLDNYVETKKERKVNKFYFQKKNLENFISDLLDTVDLFYEIFTAITEGEFRKYLTLPKAKLQRYDQNVGFIIFYEY